jgi:hypothetical protein
MKRRPIDSDKRATSDNGGKEAAGFMQLIYDRSAAYQERKPPVLDDSFLSSLTRNFSFSVYFRAGFQVNGGGGNFNFNPLDGHFGVGSLDERISEGLIAGYPFLMLENVRGPIKSPAARIRDPRRGISGMQKSLLAHRAGRH